MYNKLIERLKNIVALNKVELFKQTMQDPYIQAQMIDRNQYQMYELGQDSQGADLGQYAPATIAIKQSEGQRTDHITLNDTGAFYESMQIVESGTGEAIEADTVKPDVDLADIYPKALGLTEESLSQIRPAFYEVFMDNIKQAV